MHIAESDNKKPSRKINGTNYMVSCNFEFAYDRFLSNYDVGLKKFLFNELIRYFILQ